MKLYTTERCPTCKGKGRIRAVLPDALRSIRKKAGLTLDQMGKLMGFSKMYASDLETGRRRPTDYVVESYQKVASKCKKSRSRKVK